MRMVIGTPRLPDFFLSMKRCPSNFDTCNTLRETCFSLSTYFRKLHRKLFKRRKRWFWDIFLSLSPPTIFKKKGCKFCILFLFCFFKNHWKLFFDIQFSFWGSPVFRFAFFSTTNKLNCICFFKSKKNIFHT